MQRVSVSANQAQTNKARDARVLRCGASCVLYVCNALRVQCLPVNAEPQGQRRKGSALRR